MTAIDVLPPPTQVLDFKVMYRQDTTKPLLIARWRNSDYEHHYFAWILEAETIEVAARPVQAPWAGQHDSSDDIPGRVNVDAGLG